jgi:hypothetical protein
VQWSSIDLGDLITPTMSGFELNTTNESKVVIFGGEMAGPF